MAKVVTFGELMIRLQPYNYERFVQADHLSSPSAAVRPMQPSPWPTTAWTPPTSPSCPPTPSARRR